jgi:hypothetical protein
MTESNGKPRFTLIHCDRKPTMEALAQALFKRNGDFEVLVSRLKRRGQLRLAVSPRGEGERGGNDERGCQCRACRRTTASEGFSDAPLEGVGQRCQGDPEDPA